jgi:hypothetical protein
MQLCGVRNVPVESAMFVAADLPAEEEEEQESNYDDREDDPANPGVPCGLAVATSYTIAIIVAPCCSHDVSEL